MDATREELIEALDDVLEAWDYNGGGDAWTRECFGERIAKAKDILERAQK